MPLLGDYSGVMHTLTYDDTSYEQNLSILTTLTGIQTTLESILDRLGNIYDNQTNGTQEIKGEVSIEGEVEVNALIPLEVFVTNFPV